MPASHLNNELLMSVNDSPGVSHDYTKFPVICGSSSIFLQKEQALKVNMNVTLLFFILFFFNHTLYLVGRIVNS